MKEILQKTGAVSPGGEEGGRMSGEERRRQLVRIAIRLFSQKGFRGTTTKEIAMAAGVTEAIIFRHFATKDDLYTAILDHKVGELRLHESLAELREHAARLDDEGIFRTIITRIIECHRDDVDFLRLMFYSKLEGHELARRFRETQVQPIHGFLREYITLRQRQGAFRQCDPGAAIEALIAMPVYHSLINFLFQPDAPDVSDQEAIHTFTKIILNGLKVNADPVDADASKTGRKKR